MYRESHRSERVGWLRAAVLGANDGLISTSSRYDRRLKTGLKHNDLSAEIYGMNT